MTYLNNYKLLYQKQSGFRSEHSTESALILMTDSWLKTVNKGKHVRCVMVDFRKAVDLVDHDIFLKKLKLYKCDETCIAWFKFYLAHRSQQVSIRNTKSLSVNINCGIPQGSILGPLLFLIPIRTCLYHFQNQWRPSTYKRVIRP